MNILLFLGLAASGASFYLEDATVRIGRVSVFTNYLEVLVVLFVLAEVISYLSAARWKAVFIRKRLVAILSAAFVLLVFLVSKFASLSVVGQHAGRDAVLLVGLRNIVLLVLSLRKVKSLLDFLGYLRDHPAQTIILSFLLVIVSGAVLLMMPFTSSGGHGLSFVDALFTSTSAVCVTGLVVVDTVSSFSFSGQVVILLLIQIGGLGIMILTFFTIFVLRRSVSVEDKLLISYMLSEQDMTQLRAMVLRIIWITFGIEAGGATLLFVGFSRVFGFGEKALFYAIFHSISAFCNAGFALFSDSLEQFVGNPWISGTIAVLIILGGLSFVVLINLGHNLGDRIKNAFRSQRGRVRKLSLNSKVVLTISAFLILGGALLIYGTEHGNVLKHYPLGTQYFAAFFQSVTLRTAGFNSISFGSLRSGTYLIMIAFMFIGGASGSTAGGIKVGTVGVIYAFLSSFFRNRKSAVLFQQSISTAQVLRAFTILIFGLVVVGAATTILSFSEHDATLKILFEATSAFGTVGLSTGITSSLSVVGRLVISALMFAGRIGPLTVLAAASQESRPGSIEFPAGDISIG
jgi:trk system potassium uptake protein TrkH